MLKKLKRTLIITVIFIMLLPFSMISFAEKDEYNIDLEATERNVEYYTGFQYKIKPEDDEWKRLNHGERVLELQIPVQVLEKMSTHELVNVVLEYPCFIDMIFYDNYQEGFQVVKEHFNGLQELLNRSDAGLYLLKKYEDMGVDKVLKINNEQKRFESSLKLLYLETILAQTKISENMSDKEKNILMSLVEKNYNMQLENLEYTKALSVSAYYESLAAQQGIEVYDSIITIKTPNGTNVPVIIRDGIDVAYNNRVAIKNAIQANYPGAVVVGDATIKYNCHAYAWAGSRSLWMNDPSPYWLDGSYTLKASDSPTAVGQKIHYPSSSNAHSGNVISLTGNKIRSKWGEQSLVEHAIGNCPYSFIPLSVNFYGI